VSKDGTYHLREPNLGAVRTTNNRGIERTYFPRPDINRLFPKRTNYYRYRSERDGVVCSFRRTKNKKNNTRNDFSSVSKSRLCTYSHRTGKKRRLISFSSATASTCNFVQTTRYVLAHFDANHSTPSSGRSVNEMFRKRFYHSSRISIYLYIDVTSSVYFYEIPIGRS